MAAHHTVSMAATITNIRLRLGSLVGFWFGSWDMESNATDATTDWPVGAMVDVTKHRRGGGDGAGRCFDAECVVSLRRNGGLSSLFLCWQSAAEQSAV